MKTESYILLILLTFSLNLLLYVSSTYAQEKADNLEKNEKIKIEEEQKTEEDEKAKEKEEEESLTISIIKYPVNRVLDFIDIFRLNIGVGPGIGLNIRPTKFAQVGIENYVSARAGLGKNGSLIFKRYGLAYLESEAFTMGVGPLYTGGKQRGYTEVGATAHLAIIGAEAALDLSEIADFFLGFATVDLKDDDW